MKLKILIILFTIITLNAGGNAFKILFLAPFPVPSHWLWLENFVRELLNRGHEVTAVTNFRTTEPHENYTEIIINPPIDVLKTFTIEETFNLKYHNNIHNLFLLWDVGLLTSDHALKDKSVQELIHRNDLHFDLIIAEQFGQESFLMFAHKFKAPILTISTYDMTEYIDQAMGFWTPLSFVPHILLPYTDDMTFFERCYNVIHSLTDKIIRYFYYMPHHEALAQKYFKELGNESKPLPSLSDLEKSISIVLFNSHRATSSARPEMPGLIKVGGVHIKEPKPLPDDLQEFLDNAENGVIYFCLGSHMQSSYMAREKIEIFIAKFRTIKQRVLWKFEKELKNLPNNVMVRKWLPQTDILAHPNIILFINHGGIFGTQESTNRGVPMLSIPFYGDQHRNALRAQRAGYALVLQYKEITAETVSAKIDEMLNNMKYYRKAKEISAIFRDNLVHPMNESMYWIEYVARHKGAKHLKSAAVNFSFYQYWLLDVYGFFLAIFLIVATIAFVIMNKLMRGKVKKSTKGKNRILVNGNKKNK